jgi:outer membrane protein assembly factor BamB
MSDQWHIATATANHDDDVGSGVLVLGSNGYAMAKNGSLYAIDLPSGNMLWKQALGAADELGGHSTPAYTESTLIVSGGFGSFPTNNGPPPGGTLYGLGVDGTTKWKMSMGWPIASYVATTPDLAFATIDNSIVALEPASGRELWSYQTAGDFHGGPVISADKVFVADLSGKVYAFGLGTSAAASVRHTLHVTHPIGARPTLPAYCRL